MKEGPIPRNCPSCRNIRWNGEYTDKEIASIEKIEKQHTISIYDDYGYMNDKGCNLDPIAFDFLYGIEPEPEVFELKQVLAISPENIESRHQLMLSVIHNRIANYEKYVKEVKSGRVYANRYKRRMPGSGGLASFFRIKPISRNDIFAIFAISRMLLF